MNQPTIPWMTGDELRQALPWPQLIGALADAFRQPAIAPTRHVHQVAPQQGTVLLLMPVWQPGTSMGVKLVTVAPGNATRGLPTVHSLFTLLDADTGAPLALMDGEELTLRRTGAASALASRYLSRPESQVLLVVGTGSLAPYMAAAHCAERPIKTVMVWGRSPERAQQTVTAIRALTENPAIKVSAVTELAAAAARADLITCATTSRTPLLVREWIRPGTHIDLAGGFKPDMREADDDVIADASLFVDTCSGALAEAGDLLQPLANGRIKRDDILAELADLVTGRHPGRKSPTETTVFKSVGSAIEDLAAANLAWTVRKPDPFVAAAQED